jgi:hypothetical protein
VISDAWIDRTPPGTKQRRIPKTDAERCLEVRMRHHELRKLGRCINGPFVGTVGILGIKHGPVYRAGRCERCWNVKQKGDAASYARRAA